MTRVLWLLLAVLLGAGVPFYVFGVAGIDFLPALLASIAALIAAGWAVRQSTRTT